MATCIIHKLLRDERIVNPTDSTETDTDPITVVQTNMIRLSEIGRNAIHEAFKVRDTYKDYFNSRSAHWSWQQKHANRTN